MVLFDIFIVVLLRLSINIKSFSRFWYLMKLIVCDVLVMMCVCLMCVVWVCDVCGVDLCGEKCVCGEFVVECVC